MSTTTDFSGLITKTTVILDKPSDWADWLMLRRDRAEQNDENATRFSQLGKQEQEDYRDALETFNYESPQWEKKNRALKALASEILATVAQRHLYLLKDRTTAYDRLTTLKQHLCPSDRTRERELQTKYRDLLKSPRGRSIEKWLEEWITITDQCSDLSMAEVAGLRAQEEFLIAVKPIQDSWATNQLDKLYGAHEDDRRLPTVRDLIASFRNFHRRVNPVASSLGTFGASLQAAQPASEQRERAPQAANRRKPKSNARSSWLF
ncbi:hypothetical protein BS50DRAFT_666378 [Corynespora cassiicola Philippines]|uniref:Uncharacterized protein n=1 Tax=Corynespora cassiicola Philippines TaxID=1448308 RepID=A0A2T2N016_CORCC|nr:hypothetical protein BS50DRAFT_666378 [Corynespora cassiicola Philippines]